MNKSQSRLWLTAEAHHDHHFGNNVLLLYSEVE
jgi:hypothetical protein